MQDIYYVIGYPVKHSLSPKIQMDLARQYNQSISFMAIEIAPKDLEIKIKEFRNNSRIKGLSVTIPHKEKVFNLCDSADDLAKNIRAVSNVLFTSDRKMIGLNYDGLGVVNDMKNNHKISFQDKEILIVGAGGAAKAVIAGIITENPKSIVIANRTKEKALAVKKIFEYKYDIGVEDFQNISKRFDIVINATSLSIYNKLLPLMPNNFNPKALGYDLMYFKDKKNTIFTQWCQNNGIKAVDGKGMLFEINKAAFKYWRMS